MIFVHQDIAFDDDRFQQQIVKELSANPNQIFGAAGMPIIGRTISNLKYRRTDKYITATQLDEKTEVESVDECCFAMTKNLCLSLMFDEQTCSHWHLYAVDFCYEARRRFGIKSFVLPENIYHKMDGTSGLTTDYHFLWTIWKMTKRFQSDIHSLLHHWHLFTLDYLEIIQEYWEKTAQQMMRYDFTYPIS